MDTKKILLVDDRPKNLISLEAILEEPGREIITAGSGMEALKLLIKHSFSLILLDVQMPEMDGLETAELTRANKKNQKIPINFVTAITEGEQQKFKGYELGPVDFLFKPLEVELVQSKVQHFLKLSE